MKWNYISLLTPCPSARWLTWSIILLKVPPRYKIMVARPINENVLYPGHKETLPPVSFGKSAATH